MRKNKDGKGISTCCDMRTLCWKMIRANLAEAYGEISHLCRRLRYLEMGAEPGTSGFDSVTEERWRETTEGVLFIRMEHAYHHLNFAWNCRAFSEARVKKCAWRDYREWQRFPVDWSELWPPASLCKNPPRRMQGSGVRKLAWLAMRIPLDEVCMELEDVMKWIDSRQSSRVMITEEDFASSMRYVFIHMNEAWNSRKKELKEAIELSPRTLKRRMYLPRVFTDYWREERKR